MSDDVLPGPSREHAVVNQAYGATTLQKIVLDLFKYFRPHVEEFRAISCDDVLNKLAYFR